MERIYRAFLFESPILGEGLPLPVVDNDVISRPVELVEIERKC